MNEINAIGIMSGSSLDGLDLCCANFRKNNSSWEFEIQAHSTYHFDTILFEKLKTVRSLTGLELATFDIELGQWIGERTLDFINRNELKPSLIGSHGHTVFHQVDRQLSLQIGNPQAVAQKTGLKVVADFRQQNVLIGGNGAPLAPIGDLLLFSEYDAHVNLGGIANLSLRNEKDIIAGDIVPCNQVLNALASELGMPFDKDGDIARRGKVSSSWTETLNLNPFFKKKLPKSISNEWVNETFLQKFPSLSNEELLCTFTHFISDRISEVLNDAGAKKILVTGGGTFNSYLMSLIERRLPDAEVIVPDTSLIEAKEALIFAFMAVLRINQEPNCLSSYTGAKTDLSTGVVYFP